MNALSNVDIINICKNLNLPLHGVFSKDVLPKDLQEGFYVINLTDHRNLECGHWTILYYSPIPNSCPHLYFDSFGFICPKDLEQKLIPNYIYNEKQIQDERSSACGYFCIAFIMYLHSKPSMQCFKSFCKLFSSEVSQNDKILTLILKS